MLSLINEIQKRDGTKERREREREREIEGQESCGLRREKEG